jgi:hypothetical protein
MKTIDVNWFKVEKKDDEDLDVKEDHFDTSDALSKYNKKHAGRTSAIKMVGE